MKAMLTAFAAMVIIAIAAPVILDQLGFSAADQTSSAAVRLN